MLSFAPFLSLELGNVNVPSKSHPLARRRTRRAARVRAGECARVRVFALRVLVVMAVTWERQHGALCDDEGCLTLPKFDLVIRNQVRKRARAHSWACVVSHELACLRVRL